MRRLNVMLLISALLLVFSVGTPYAAGISGPEAEKELKKFQGTWVMVSGEKDSKKIPDEHVNQSKIVYDGNTMKLVTPHQTAEVIVAEIVKLDPSGNPKQMHFIRKNGPSAGKTIVGIYEFDGEDIYKFAFDPTGGVTLGDFATEDGTGHMRHTWKRVK